MLNATTTTPSAAPLSAASVRFVAIDTIPFSDGRRHPNERETETSAKVEAMHRRAPGCSGKKNPRAQNPFRLAKSNLSTITYRSLDSDFSSVAVCNSSIVVHVSPASPCLAAAPCRGALRSSASRFAASRIVRLRPTASLPRPAARAAHLFKVESSGVRISSRCRGDPTFRAWICRGVRRRPGSGMA
jgi:hypothetical protein